MPTTTCAPSSSPAPGGGSAPAPTCRREARRSPVAAATSRRRQGVPRDGGGMRQPAHLRVHQAGDRGDQRRRGRRRRHDDPADGHPPGEPIRPSSGSCSPAAASCPRRARRGSSRGSSASAAPPSGATPAACSPPTRRWPAGWCAACTQPTSCWRVANGIAREIADNTAPVSVALTRQMLWRMLGAVAPDGGPPRRLAGHPESRSAATTPARASTSFLEKRPAVFPVKVSDGLPDIFPDYTEPTFH